MRLDSRVCSLHMRQKNSNTSTKFTSRSQARVAPRVRVNIIVHSDAVRSTGATAHGMRVQVVLVENCAGSPIPLARRIAIGPNFPTHSCWCRHSPAFDASPLVCRPLVVIDSPLDFRCCGQPTQKVGPARCGSKFAVASMAEVRCSSMGRWIDQRSLPALLPLLPADSSSMARSSDSDRRGWLNPSIRSRSCRNWLVVV